MDKKQINLETWRQKIDQWRASGKNGMAWTREQQISYRVFLYWKMKIENIDSKPIAINSFEELKDGHEEGLGIELSYRGIKIHLSNRFDSITLKRCLQVLREVSC